MHQNTRPSRIYILFLLFLCRPDQSGHSVLATVTQANHSGLIRPFSTGLSLRPSFRPVSTCHCPSSRGFSSSHWRHRWRRIAGGRGSPPRRRSWWSCGSASPGDRKQSSASVVPKIKTTLWNCYSDTISALRPPAVTCASALSPGWWTNMRLRKCLPSSDRWSGTTGDWPMPTWGLSSSCSWPPALPWTWSGSWTPAPPRVSCPGPSPARHSLHSRCPPPCKHSSHCSLTAKSWHTRVQKHLP